jgi:Tetratricopeptide repeat
MQTRRLHQIGRGANENGRVVASDDRLWVVDLGGGQLRVVRGREALNELIVSHGLPSSARAYELSAVPKTLAEIPEVAAAFETPAPAPAPTAAPVVEEVAVAPVLETPAPAPAKAEVEVAAPAAPPASAAPAPETAVAPHHESHDADFALLDRPFDDSDYFEDPPRAGWPRLAGVGAVVVLLLGGGYELVHSRHGEPAPIAATVAEPTVIAAAPQPPPAPMPAPAPPASSAPVAAAAPAPPSAPVAAPEPAPPSAPVAAPAPARAEPLPDPAVAPPAPPAAPSPSYAALVAEGRRLFDRGHGRKAEALFEQALAEQPDGIDALVGLAYAQLDRGKMQEAIGSFKRALDQDGSHARAVFGLAESYRQQGNRAAALAAFKRFLKLQPSGGDADIARRLVQDLNAGG